MHHGNVDHAGQALAGPADKIDRRGVSLPLRCVPSLFALDTGQRRCPVSPRTTSASHRLRKARTEWHASTLATREPFPARRRDTNGSVNVPTAAGEVLVTDRVSQAAPLGSVEADGVIHEFGESLERSGAGVELGLDLALVD